MTVVCRSFNCICTVCWWEAAINVLALSTQAKRLFRESHVQTSISALLGGNALEKLFPTLAKPHNALTGDYGLKPFTELTSFMGKMWKVQSTNVNINSQFPAPNDTDRGARAGKKQQSPSPTESNQFLEVVHPQLVASVKLGSERGYSGWSGS